MAFANGLHRSSKTRYTIYTGDGSGRDSYVIIGNGTNFKHGSYKDVAPTVGYHPPHAPAAMYAGPIQKFSGGGKEATAFRYWGDGSGRDYYVTKDCGGLIPVCPSKSPNSAFYTNLRQYSTAKSVDRTHRNFRITSVDKNGGTQKDGQNPWFNNQIKNVIRATVLKQKADSNRLSTPKQGPDDSKLFRPSTVGRDKSTSSGQFANNRDNKLAYPTGHSQTTANKLTQSLAVDSDATKKRSGWANLINSMQFNQASGTNVGALEESPKAGLSKKIVGNALMQAKEYADANIYNTINYDTEKLVKSRTPTKAHQTIMHSVDVKKSQEDQTFQQIQKIANQINEVQLENFENEKRIKQAETRRLRSDFRVSTAKPHQPKVMTQSMSVAHVNNPVIKQSLVVKPQNGKSTPQDKVDMVGIREALDGYVNVDDMEKKAYERDDKEQAAKSRYKANQSEGQTTVEERRANTRQGVRRTIKDLLNSQVPVRGSRPHPGQSTKDELFSALGVNNGGPRRKNMIFETVDGQTRLNQTKHTRAKSGILYRSMVPTTTDKDTSLTREKTNMTYGGLNDSLVITKAAAAAGGSMRTSQEALSLKRPGTKNNQFNTLQVE